MIYIGDLTLRNIVTSIHNSPAWKNGHTQSLFCGTKTTIVPNINQVLAIVDTNFGVHGVQSSQFYTHFSLLKSLEGGLGLPCLNHACDEGVRTMSDLFASGK